MSKIKKIFIYLLKPKLFLKREKLRYLNKHSEKYSDQEYIRKIFKIQFDKEINLENPKTFNEKLNWLKLNDRKNLYTLMVDKYEVKKIVTNIIGQQYVAKCFGIWDSFDKINFNELPDTFVLKSTHNCGGVVIIKNKKEINMHNLKSFFDKQLSINYYWHCREWPYKNVKPRILAEEYIEDCGRSVLPVYKMFCFSGKVKIIQVIQNDKTSKETIDYYDEKWNLLQLRQNFPNSKTKINKPQNFDNMVTLAEKLSQNLPFIRVDLYSINKKILFSEYTFYSDAGFTKFYPNSWDKHLGDLIKLNI